MSAGFVHLHTHSEYSVLDGASKVADLIERCRRYDMRACALTDHGALFGAIDFYSEARKAGVKPILGCELYMAKGARTEKTNRSSGSSNNHFLMLCENEEGYHNLCRLSSLGYLEGFHYKPRIDLDLLHKHKSGLIATSSCLAGEIPQHILNDDLDAANASVEKFIEILGRDHFLMEIQEHGLPEDKKVNPIVAELAEKHGLTLIATNDCHYTDKEDAEAHEVLLAVQTGATLDQDDRFKFPSKEFYFCSGEEMRQKLPEYPEAIANTEKVADRCNVELNLDNHLIPEFVPPEGVTNEGHLESLVEEGMRDRYGETPNPEYMERAKFELGVIEQMGFVDYFLVVWDLINFARETGVPVGPGRGSGAGSVVAYALKITNIDPMRYQLLFERFLNPERVSMPDFDIDFCYNRRQEIIDYTREKYGADNVCQIITFGKMLAKQVVRNVGRVMGMSFGDVDKIAKLIPEGPGEDGKPIKLKEARSVEKDLDRVIRESDDLKQLWGYAERLEGTIGNCGTHAAGVVICSEPLMDHVPLYKASNSDVVATQFEMKKAEQVGLLKMDYLGLRTLTVIHETVRLIRETDGIEIDIDAIEPNDEKAYELLRSGNTTGIFQLESSGMRELSKRIGLESLEEICALVALYRPGPMALKDDYIANKHDNNRIKYDHPLLEPILKETYGIALYQEQVMQIVQVVAGFSLGQADIMRRAMGKKSAELMAEQRIKFVEGANENDIDKKTATHLFDKIEQFAGYGFNKSHSMAYAYVAYQTAFLKANYPCEFMAALLTSESNNLEKVAMYVDECRRTGIEVLAPDINMSGGAFTVENDCVRFGLNAIKHVGEGPVDAIVRGRDDEGPFRDVFEFCARLDSKSVNRRLVEALTRAGAFASTGWNRRQIESELDNAIGEGQLSQRERAAGQTSLIDMLGDDAEQVTLHSKPNLPEWPEHEVLVMEKEMMGLYVSSHPLASHTEVLDRFTNYTEALFDEAPENSILIVGGLVTVAKQHITASKKKMAFVTMETLQGGAEVTVFNDLYEAHAGLLMPDMVLLIEARVSSRNSRKGLIATRILPIEEAENELTRAIHVRVNTVGIDEPELNQLATILGAEPGPCDVYLHCVAPSQKEVTVHATDACRVRPSLKLRKNVETLLGEDTIWYTGGNALPRHPE
jgi:DNA polymerase-3 subunit alpha